MKTQPVILYVVYRDGAPVEVAQGDDQGKLLAILKDQYISVEGLTLQPATECPVEHVAKMVLCLLGKWLFFQFSMAQGMAGGRIVRPT